MTPCPESAPQEVKDCVKAIMRDKGYDEDRAYSICVAQHKKDAETSNSLSKLVRLSQPWEYNFSFEKTVDVEKGIRAIQGYASTEDVDLDMEIVTREAMAGAVTGYMSHDGRYATVRFMHDKSRPIGKVVDAKPTKKGLYVKAVIAQGTQASEEAWNLIEQGVISAFSIGGKVLEAQREKLEDGRSVNKITKLNWAETSVVDSPANRSTMFEVLSKSVDPVLDEIDEINKLSIFGGGGESYGTGANLGDWQKAERSLDSCWRVFQQMRITGPAAQSVIQKCLGKLQDMMSQVRAIIVQIERNRDVPVEMEKQKGTNNQEIERKKALWKTIQKEMRKNPK